VAVAESRIGFYSVKFTGIVITAIDTINTTITFGLFGNVKWYSTVSNPVIQSIVLQDY
jgi:hypothetical protein